MIEDMVKEMKKADQPANQQRYNLAGQRVPANYKGIVIQNGQKHLVK